MNKHSYVFDLNISLVCKFVNMHTKNPCRRQGFFSAQFTRVQPSRRGRWIFGLWPKRRKRDNPEPVGNGPDRSAKQPIYCRAGALFPPFLPGGHAGPPLRRFNKMRRQFMKESPSHALVLMGVPAKPPFCRLRRHFPWQGNFL